MTVKSTNGRALTVANDYSHDTSFIAEVVVAAVGGLAGCGKRPTET